jgi:TM2 domain-containing membrane protein YozV/ribosomal protein L40E
MSNWYINSGGKVYGPIDNETLKQLANKGKIKPETPIRQGSEGTWSKCGKVKGLFTGLSTHKATSIIEVKPEPEPEPIKTIATQTPQIVSEKTCMYCGELISLIAVKCKHCKEYLDPNLRKDRSEQAPVVQQPAPAPQTFVFQQPAMVPIPKWNPGVAAVLSFLLPGLGQIYKGQLFNGLLWLFVVGMGYIFLIIPGLILHVMCVVGASMGDPYK